MMATLLCLRIMTLAAVLLTSRAAAADGVVVTWVDDESRQGALTQHIAVSSDFRYAARDVSPRTANGTAEYTIFSYWDGHQMFSSADSSTYSARPLPAGEQLSDRLQWFLAPWPLLASIRAGGIAQGDADGATIASSAMNAEFRFDKNDRLVSVTHPIGREKPPAGTALFEYRDFERIGAADIPRRIQFTVTYREDPQHPRISHLRRTEYQSSPAAVEAALNFDTVKAGLNRIDNATGNVVDPAGKVLYNYRERERNGETLRAADSAPAAAANPAPALPQSTSFWNQITLCAIAALPILGALAWWALHRR
ncbi:hypothetical protein BH11PLA1_BH11PLA1_18000 [soil metagenome]